VTSLFVLLWACAEPRPVEPVLALDGVAGRGEAQFQMVCAQCHGAGGNGIGQTPALRGRAHRLTDAELVGAMVNGRGSMRRTRITDAQAADVLAYVRATFPEG